MAKHDARDDEPIVGINVTPLIDVVLVLLVVMIATTALALRVIPVRVAEPGAATDAAPEVAPLAITIAADGALALDGAAITERELSDRALAYTRGLADPELASATVAADDATDQARFVHVLDVLRRAGVHRLGIRARPR